MPSSRAFAIRTEGTDPRADTFSFRAQKTMYGGKTILTLEVQDDNGPARTLYQRFGFEDVVYGDSAATRFLAKPLEG